MSTAPSKANGQLRLVLTKENLRTVAHIAISELNKEKAAAATTKYLLDNAKARLSSTIAASRRSPREHQVTTGYGESQDSEHERAEATRSRSTFQRFNNGRHVKTGAAVISVVLAVDVFMIVGAGSYEHMTGELPAFAESAWNTAQFVFMLVTALVGVKATVHRRKSNSVRKVGSMLVMCVGLFLLFAGFLPAFSLVYDIQTAVAVSTAGGWYSAAWIETVLRVMSFVPAVYAHLTGEMLISAGLWLSVTADTKDNHCAMVVLTANYGAMNQTASRLRRDLFDLAEMIGDNRAMNAQIAATIDAFIDEGMAYFGALRRRSDANAERARIDFLDRSYSTFQ
jgi:hypothetical protein